MSMESETMDPRLDITNAEEMMGKGEDRGIGSQAKQALRARAQRLMQEAAGLEALAQMLPEKLHPQADNALFTMIMKVARGL